MDKAEIEKKLAELMDIVPECEGLIAADLEGKVIIGQTILDSDHNEIAQKCAIIIKEAQNLGSTIKKGAFKDTTIELEEGFAVIVGNNELILVAIAGTDGKASLGLLKRKMITIL